MFLEMLSFQKEELMNSISPMELTKPFFTMVVIGTMKNTWKKQVVGHYTEDLEKVSILERIHHNSYTIIFWPMNWSYNRMETLAQNQAI